MPDVKITYLGQCATLLDFGDVRIVTDPYLSDFLDKCLYSEKTPWERLYAPMCTLKELKPDGIIISHSHEDHLDPWTIVPYILDGGQAVFAAPAPECHILERIGVARPVHAVAGESFFIKGVKITPITCAHTIIHADINGRLSELSYFIEYKGIKIFFGGDMSLYDGLEEYIVQSGCQVLMLPTNGEDEDRTSRGIIGNISAEDAARIAAGAKATLIPLHHDLYAINGRSREDILACSEKAGADTALLLPGETFHLSI